MIRLIRFFFIIKSYAAVFPGRNTPIVPGTGYRQSGLRIARNPPLRAYRPAAPHPRRHGKTIRQPVPGARSLLPQYRARMREHCDVRTRRHRRSRIPQLRHSLRTGRQRRAVPAGRAPGDTGYGNAISPNVTSQQPASPGYAPACRPSCARDPTRVSSPTPHGRRCRQANWASSRRSPSSRGRRRSPS